jgi:cytoskeletal protein RodZ
MKRTNFRKLTSVVALVILMIAAIVIVQAQYGSSKPQTVAQKPETPAATQTPTPAATQTPTPAATQKPETPAAAVKGEPTLTATLVDPEKKAAQKAATVEVKTTGIDLIDPAKANEMAKAGQGHLHYQVDGGPVIATTTTKLSFHGLTSGPHKIVVMLAGNDHNPLGPQQTLEVTIP